MPAELASRDSLTRDTLSPDGDPQRHARLVLRRRALPRRGRRARARARSLVGEGADILDVGGESTRPGAEPVAAEEELRRVLPVIEGIAGQYWAGSMLGARATEVSIDTSKAAVARAALAAGAGLVNDVSALRGDPEMAGVVADSGADCCLMHMLGEPRTMQRGPALRGRRRTRSRRSSRSAWSFAVGDGHRRGADHARPGDRLRQDARAQPRSCCDRLGRADARSGGRW